MSLLARGRDALVALGLMTGAALGACPDLPAPGAPGPVIQLDVVDATKPRDPPLLQIGADGQVQIRVRDTLRQGEMPREALAALVHDIVVTGQVARIDGAAIRQMIYSKGVSTSGGGVVLGALVADAPTSFLTITLPDCQFEVEVFASAHLSRSHPDIHALQRFREIEIRLLEIFQQVQGG